MITVTSTLPRASRKSATPASIGVEASLSARVDEAMLSISSILSLTANLTTENRRLQETLQDRDQQVDTLIEENSRHVRKLEESLKLLTEISEQVSFYKDSYIEMKNQAKLFEQLADEQSVEVDRLLDAIKHSASKQTHGHILRSRFKLVGTDNR